MYRITAHRRLNEWEQYDNITITLEPRLKESELSGDEWRQSMVVRAYFKGHEITIFSLRDIQAVCNYMWSELHKGWAIPEAVVKLDHDYCDQPGCNFIATKYFWLDRLTSPDGTFLDPKDTGVRYYRKFCANHCYRGDSDREDCDSNMTEFDKKELE